MVSGGLLRGLIARSAGAWVGAVVCLVAPVVLMAGTITLDDGRVLAGRMGLASAVVEDPEKPAKQAGEADVKLILFVDNGLTRTFVPKGRVVAVNEAAGDPQEKIRIPWQRVTRSGLRIGSVGSVIKITDFDEHGRRVFSMATQRGPTDVIQAITEITPVYAKVEAWLGGPKQYVWEMRIAPSSIPSETLHKILLKTIDPKKLDHRLRIVRFYLQSERYQDAQAELEKVVRDFPDQKELDAEYRALRQLGARQLLDEILHRKRAGQHRFAQALLGGFPADRVAGETLEEVREMERESQAEQLTLEQTVQALRALAEPAGTNAAKNGRQDAPNEPSTAEEPSREGIHPAHERFGEENRRAREPVALLCREIAAELSLNTLQRMAAFSQLADDPSLDAEEKLALAISGWLVGSNHATENLAQALSLYQARELVTQYLREPTEARRGGILDELRSLEGATCEQVALLVQHMKPPLEPAPVSGAPDGYYELQVPGLVGEPNVTYHVQLPPEYDPHRLYPLIVTLNGTGSTPLMQLDWWAGAVDPERTTRVGQATRHGYIVMSVEWQTPHQGSYEYSAREHHAVLSSLRDTCRRFAVQTNRVFLSGHDIGGDAAWDLGLAHPDLWAGVIPIVAVADRYCSRYWENARHVPFYVVAGELDGDKMSRNSVSFDRYLRNRYDATVVEYLGRGHEHFYEEIQRLFQWMGTRERDFFPKDLTASTMRSWDNYFWWVEVTQMSRASIVEPHDWPPPRGTQPLTIKASVKRNNNLFVRTGRSETTVWLAPQLVDFQSPVSVTVDGRRVTGKSGASPDLAVLLEDVRTRSDRQQPFWAKVSSGR
jgi:predicted esterase